MLIPRFGIMGAAWAKRRAYAAAGAVAYRPVAALLSDSLRVGPAGARSPRRRSSPTGSPRALAGRCGRSSGSSRAARRVVVMAGAAPGRAASSARRAARAAASPPRQRTVPARRRHAETTELAGEIVGDRYARRTRHVARTRMRRAMNTHAADRSPPSASPAWCCGSSASSSGCRRSTTPTKSRSWRAPSASRRAPSTRTTSSIRRSISTCCSRGWAAYLAACWLTGARRVDRRAPAAATSSIPTGIYTAGPRARRRRAGPQRLPCCTGSRRAPGRAGAGLAAALFLAVSPLHVRDSHYVKHDVPATLAIVARLRRDDADLAEAADAAGSRRRGTVTRGSAPAPRCGRRVLDALLLHLPGTAARVGHLLRARRPRRRGRPAARWPSRRGERGRVLRALAVPAGRAADGVARHHGQPADRRRPRRRRRGRSARAARYARDALAEPSASGGRSSPSSACRGCWPSTGGARDPAAAFPDAVLLFIANTAPPAATSTRCCRSSPCSPAWAFARAVGPIRTRGRRSSGSLVTLAAAPGSWRAAMRTLFFRQADTRTLAQALHRGPHSAGIDDPDAAVFGRR